jgi:hydroxymethylbilane synthase
MTDQIMIDHQSPHKIAPATQSVVVIGTRSSKLALAQTHMIRDALLAAHPDITIEVEHITTKGDVILDRPLSAIGDKGLFVTEIEEALRAGRIDLAVHSAKDLPSELPPDMAIAAFPRRADARDALIARAGLGLADLPAGACVGTSSLRRACQLRRLRPDLRIADLRGNVDTRLRKLHEGMYDAVVLAAAGLDRLGLAHEVTELLDPHDMHAAGGQPGNTGNRDACWRRGGCGSACSARRPRGAGDGHGRARVSGADRRRLPGPGRGLRPAG